MEENVSFLDRTAFGFRIFRRLICAPRPRVRRMAFRNMIIPCTNRIIGDNLYAGGLITDFVIELPSERHKKI